MSNKFLEFMSIISCDIETQIEFLKKSKEYIVYLNHFSDDVIISMVETDGYNILFVQNPSEYLKEVAIRSTPDIIYFIDKPSDYLCELAIMENPSLYDDVVFTFGANFPQSITERFLEQNPSNIQFIKNPSIETQLYAVQIDGNAIKNLLDKYTVSKEVKLCAVQQNGIVLKYIIDAYEYWHNSGIFNKYPDDEIVLAAIRQNCFAICYIDNPTTEMNQCAYEQNQFWEDLVDFFREEDFLTV